MKAIESKEIEMIEDVEDTHEVEMQKGSLPLLSLVEQKSDVASISETISLEDKPPIGEILKASVKLMEAEYKTSYHKVLTKAEAFVKIIYTSDDEIASIQSFETKIPVMGFVDLESLDETMTVALESRLERFSIKPIYQEMKATSFNVEGAVLFDVSVYQKENVDVIQDLYGLNKLLIPYEESIEVLDNDINVCEEIRLSQSMMIPDLDSIKVLDVQVEPSIANMDLLDGKIAIEGNLNFSILYHRMDRKMLENKKMELPFRQVIKVERDKTKYESSNGVFHQRSFL